MPLTSPPLSHHRTFAPSDAPSYRRTLAPSHARLHRRTFAQRTIEERGAALVMALTSMTLLTALGTVLVLGTITETAIAAGYREGTEAFYAAEAAAEFVVSDVAAASDWDAILRDGETSMFVDGPPGGTREVGVATIDLTEATGEINAIASARSGDDAPPYGLYAYGWLADLLPSAPGRSPMYVVVCVADLSNDDDPDRRVGIIALAYGPRGASRAVAITVAQAVGIDDDDPPPVRIVSWAELR